MRLSTIVNTLKREGSIEQIRVNRYVLHNTARVRQLGLSIFNGSERRVFTLREIHNLFAVRVGPEEDRNWVYRTSPAGAQSTTEGFITGRPITARQTTATIERPRVRIRIDRGSYHGSGSGSNRRGLEDALRSISADADGVRRSFGLEWEINALTSQQESDLAYLLREMPAHFTERDGSLTSTGVEIIFLPVSAEKIVEIWNKLQAFCRENHVHMEGAGAHITYGVSNSNVSISDLRIRLNRISYAVKATCTQRAIRRVFGRDFTHYACIPQSTTDSSRYVAWAANRGTGAYELRLCHWEGDISKIVAFMKATEFIFSRTFNAQDFINIFNIMGADIDGQ